MADGSDLSTKLSTLNVNATEFVPSFLNNSGPAASQNNGEQLGIIITNMTNVPG